MSRVRWTRSEVWLDVAAVEGAAGIATSDQATVHRHQTAAMAITRVSNTRVWTRNWRECVDRGTRHRLQATCQPAQCALIAPLKRFVTFYRFVA